MKLPTPISIKNNRVDDFMGFVYRRFVDFPTFKKVRISTDYTVDKEDFYIGITNTSAPRSIDLPAIESMPISMMLIIKDESGGAGTNVITINADGAETIDGSLTQVINSNYGVFRILRGPTAWFLW